MNPSLKDTIDRAWEAFDSGDLGEARRLYEEGLKEMAPHDSEARRAILMGLVYVESFSKRFDEARAYAATLLSSAQTPEQRHIYLHQAGMVERMAGSYSRAWELFDEEAELIRAYLMTDEMSISANAYERGYVLLQCGHLTEAEAEMIQSLEHAQKSKDPMCIGCAYRGLGEILKERKEYNEAQRAFEEAITFFTSAEDHIAAQEVRSLMSEAEDQNAVG